MLRSPLRPPLQPALRSALAAAIGSLWSAGYNFASSTLPSAIAALTRGGLATRIGPAGNVEFGPCNILIGAGTQNVTVTAQPHTLTLLGTGSITLSGAATGTLSGTGATDRVLLTFTPTAGTLTLTVSGSITLPRLQIGTVSRAEDDASLVTTSAARFLPRIAHNPLTPFSPVGLLVSGQATQLASTTLTNWTTFRSSAPVLDGNDYWTYTATGVGPTFGAFRQNAPTWAGNTSYVYSLLLVAVAGRTYQISFTDTAAGFAGGVTSFAFGADANTAPTITNSGRATGVAVRGEGLAGSWFLSISFTTQATPDYHYYEVKCSSHFGAGETLKIKLPQVETGTVATSCIPNSGTGTLVRVGDWFGGGFTGAALTGLLTPTSPFTLQFKYLHADPATATRALFGLCAGASAGGTNRLTLETNGTQARLSHSGGSSAFGGTVTHDGATANTIAVSCDPVAAKMSIAVNGGASVETTGIAYTGAGVTALILGARDSSGTDQASEFTVTSLLGSPGYLTGAALQARST